MFAWIALARPSRLPVEPLLFKPPRHMCTSTYPSSPAMPLSQLRPWMRGIVALAETKILFQPLSSLCFLHFLYFLSKGRPMHCFLICKMENITAHCHNTSMRLISAAPLVSSTSQPSGLRENLGSAVVGSGRNNRWKKVNICQTEKGSSSIRFPWPIESCGVRKVMSTGFIKVRLI